MYFSIFRRVAPKTKRSRISRGFFRPLLVGPLLVALLLNLHTGTVRGEVILELFQVRWPDLTAKMPEIAEAGYGSLWVPNPAKASSVYSVGYDQYDPFDLGDKNQQGSVATMYGTKAELLQMVETAHRFGIRVYFDNIMNHRAFTVPGFNSSTPTNFYPGLEPRDFHLQTVGSYYANWPSVQDYNNAWDVQYEPLSGLVDLATEPGSVNGNFGNTLGSTTTKPNFIRQPKNPEYYMSTNLPTIGGPWRPFNGTNGTPVAEDVNSYVIRSALWTLATTKCDGFRLDAVKHVPSPFFGDTGDSANGYCGAIQAMFDYVHGYGNNVTGNGYVEGDDNRNSLFDTEAPRNDAMLFGEHLGQAPNLTYAEYIIRGMRLLNAPLRDKMNDALNGNSTLAGLDGRDYVPYSGAIDSVQGVQFAQSQDASGSYAAHRELQNAYYLMHEGLTVLYSDGYNKSGPPNYFPSIANANYLGEYGDNWMPDTCYMHNQLARGGTWSRWGDYNCVAFERYDYRESTNTPDQDVVLFVMNDNYGNPGDIAFDDGVGQTYDGYYGGKSISNSRGQGLVVGFPPGSVLSQLASSTPGNDRTYSKLLVHAATKILGDAQASGSINNADPAQRLVYVGGQNLASGGGAIELTIPSGGWVMYGYQWPEASRANLKDAVTLRQNGADAPRMTVYRRDGYSGDANYNPLFPFKMRGSVDQLGNVVTGAHASNLTYAIDVPIVTNASFDILVRGDASAINTLVKLDGGADLDSQMGFGPTNSFDLRNNKPGTATDVFLGYEQTQFQYRNGPEKFAARNTGLRNNVTSLGAETYHYVVGGTNFLVNGLGNGTNIFTSTATFVYHDPADTNTAAGAFSTATQRVPLAPTNGQPADVYVKVGYKLQINTCFIYYTTDGNNPEGAYGVGKGTTQVVQAFWATNDVADTTIDWWRGTIPAQASGTDVRYKVALFKGGSIYAGQSIGTISDADNSKLYGLTQAAITNFNPTTVRVWLHNDRNTNNTTVGLSEGFHILRGRTFLPRTNKSSVFNTFVQTFYYDASAPAGVFAAPSTNGINTISNATYQVIVRADSSATGMDYNIVDSSTNNDDAITGQNNGNGLTNGVPKFISVVPVTPTASLNTAYSNYPVEFRFTYVAVPTNGTAIITVRLKKATTALIPSRVTTLTNSVNTAAQSQFVHVSDPATDGMTLTLGSNDVYTINTCFSTNLANASDINFFSIYVNGSLLPRRDAFNAPLYTINPSDTSCGPGLRLLSCGWTGVQPGDYTIQVLYTNNVILSDTRTFSVGAPVVVPPPNITGLANNNQLVVWDSASNVNYQVLATTNLAYPFIPVSDVIPASGPSAVFFDNAPDPISKFFKVEILP